MQTAHQAHLFWEPIFEKKQHRDKSKWRLDLLSPYCLKETVIKQTQHTRNTSQIKIHETRERQCEQNSY